MRQQVVVKKNAGWEFLANAALLIVPPLVFITDGFVTKNMGPAGPFLFFAYLTHIKDLVVMFGVAVPDMIRAGKVIKERQPELISPKIQEGQNDYPYAVLTQEGQDQEMPGDPTPEIKYEITDVPESRRTTVKFLALNLSFTATALFFVLVLPAMDKPNTTLEKFHNALVILNHSSDTLIQIVKYVRYNIPLHTAGTKLQRVMKEYGLPLAVYSSYSVFLYAFQALGGVNENGEPLYAAIDYKKSPKSAVIMCGALSFGMPIVNKALTLCLEAIQFCIHSPAGSVRQACSSVASIGRNVCALLTGPCRSAPTRTRTDLETACVPGNNK